MEQEAPDRKLRRYAKVSRELLPNYTRWNPIIINQENYDNELPLKLNRYQNMLRSDVAELHKLAATQLPRQHDGIWAQVVRSE